MRTGPARTPRRDVSARAVLCPHVPLRTRLRPPRCFRPLPSLWMASNRRCVAVRPCHRIGVILHTAGRPWPCAARFGRGASERRVRHSPAQATAKGRHCEKGVAPAPGEEACSCFGVHRSLCAGCAKSRLFSTRFPRWLR